MGSRVNDLTGKVFNRLTVVGFAGIINKRYKWNCICDCGNTTTVEQYLLTSGGSKSCGCYRKEFSSLKAKTHGMSKTSTYRIWCSMKQRCIDKNCEAYARYGGRGITICNEWLESFENFLKDMGEKPKGRSLDRIDNDGHYCKENCRWATRKEQSRNYSRNINVLYDEVKYCLTDLCEKLGINFKWASQRLRKYKYPIELIIPGAKLITN